MERGAPTVDGPARRRRAGAKVYTEKDQGPERKGKVERLGPGSPTKSRDSRDPAARSTKGGASPPLSQGGQRGEEVKKGPAKLPSLPRGGHGSKKSRCWQVKSRKRVVVDGCSFVAPCTRAVFDAKSNRQQTKVNVNQGRWGSTESKPRSQQT
jgi:hypothetical protein